MTIRSEQRHKRKSPCKICGGGDDDLRGRDKRCHGFISEDGEYEHCSREEHALLLSVESNSGTYAHRMYGPCRCGIQHGEAKSAPTREDFLAVYDYRDEHGVLLFQVIRLNKPGKHFRQRRPNGSEWLWQTEGVRRVPYRLAEVIAADPAKTVYICEGEKDVDNVFRQGHIATCNPSGAGKWHYVADDAKKALAGRHVVVIADADDKGRTHAQSVAASLMGHARSVRVIEPPVPHKDVTEFLEAKGLFEDLIAPPTAISSDWNLIEQHDLSSTLPPVPWVCESLGLAPGAVTLIAGYGYSRKTMALQSMGLAVAAGKPIWTVFRASKGPFVHLDYEQGRRLTQERYQRLARGMGFELGDLPENSLRVACMPRVYLDEKAIADELVRLVDGSVMVLVDSLRAAFPHADENSSEVRAYLDVLSRVSERTGTMFAVIHHARKPQQDDRSGPTFAIRGSSALFDACQSVYVFIGEKDSQTRVHHQKDRIRGACCEEFAIDGIDLPMGDDSRWGLRVVHLEKEQIDQQEKAKERVKLERAVIAIEAVIREADGAVFKGSQKALLSEAGFGKHDFGYQAIKVAKTDRRVVQGGTYKYPEWRLP